MFNFLWIANVYISISFYLKCIRFTDSRVKNGNTMRNYVVWVPSWSLISSLVDKVVLNESEQVMSNTIYTCLSISQSFILSIVCKRKKGIARHKSVKMKSDLPLLDDHQLIIEVSLQLLLISTVSFSIDCVWIWRYITYVIWKLFIAWHGISFRTCFRPIVLTWSYHCKPLLPFNLLKTESKYALIAFQSISK